jgi:uncharacterized protein YlxW (UPF0749 family)
MGKLAQDWKFIIQLCAISLVAGGILQINYALQSKVSSLEKSDEEKTRAIILIEERFDSLKRDNQELKAEIRQLRERLEIKKIVNVASKTPLIVGDQYFEWQP